MKKTIEQIIAEADARAIECQNENQFGLAEDYKFLKSVLMIVYQHASDFVVDKVVEAWNES